MCLGVPGRIVESRVVESWVVESWDEASGARMVRVELPGVPR